MTEKTRYSKLSRNTLLSKIEKFDYLLRLYPENPILIRERTKAQTTLNNYDDAYCIQLRAYESARCGECARVPCRCHFGG